MTKTSHQKICDQITVNVSKLVHTVILRIGPLAYQERVGERMCYVHIDHLLPAGDAK